MRRPIVLFALLVGCGSSTASGVADAAHPGDAVADRAASPKVPDAGAGSPATGSVCTEYDGGEQKAAWIFGGSCVNPWDCEPKGSDAFCVYDPAEGCSAKGRCLTVCGPLSGCATDVYNCACDGSEVVLLPCVLDGYAQQPLRGTPVGWSCGGDAGSPSDAGN